MRDMREEYGAECFTFEGYFRARNALNECIDVSV